MARILSLIATLGLVTIPIAGCGSSTTERAASGGALGAGAGAAGAAVTGGSAATGALIGGAVGAAAGGLTDEDDVDLGEPIWE